MKRSGLFSLQLEHFRSHRARYLTVPEGKPLVILTGPNGSGKTNILEALSMLTPGRGLRGARLAQMTHVPACENSHSDETSEGRSPPIMLDRQKSATAPLPKSSFWRIAGQFFTPDGPFDLSAHLCHKTKKRKLILNEAPLMRQIDLIDHTRALWLTPQMDTLFLQGTSARRNFLNRLIAGLNPAYTSPLIRYEALLRERRRLLDRSAPNLTWVRALTPDIVKTGLAILKLRQDAVINLNQDLARPNPFSLIQVHLKGTLEAWIDEDGLETAQDKWTHHLNTLSHSYQAPDPGPHQTRLVVMRADGREAAQLSTGEQKLALLHIILAACKLQDQAEALSLLLLDEVVSHLDPLRRAYVADALIKLPAQVWVTGTEKELFCDWPSCAHHLTLSA